MKPRPPTRPDLQDWDARAAAALETARDMPPGPERIQALKNAGVLRGAADARAMFTRPAKPAVVQHES
ncbi:MAG: hypothetical protein JWR49_1034 [Tardiphaga sp.]|jgi:hypothetical protein|nr:hypothetical protein [Tardiphaga sp.]